MDQQKPFLPKIIGLIIAAVCICVVFFGGLVACGSSDTGGQVAHIRAVHGLKGVGSVSVTIDGVMIAGDLRYAEGSVYRDSDESARTVVVSLDQTGEVLIEEQFDFADNEYYTLIVSPRGSHANSGTGGIFGSFQGSNSDYEVVVLSDDNLIKDESIGKVRFYNGAKEAGKVDVYFTKDSDTLDNRDPDFLYQDFQQVTYYLDRKGGDYRYRLALSGSRDVTLDSGSFRLNHFEIRTIVILDGPNDDYPLVSTVLLDKN